MPNTTASTLEFQPLGKHHDRAAFSCGKESLDRYLKEQASQDARKRIAATFVLIAKNDKRVLGFYSLASLSINLSDLPPELAKKLPKYPTVPATLLGRLAVDANFQRQGFGEMLLVNAMSRTLNNSRDIASHALVVDVIDGDAAIFYQKFGFLPLVNRADDVWPRRYFISLKTIEASGLLP